MGDPGGSDVRELPDHSTTGPSGRLALCEACGEGARIDITVVGVGGSAGLANDNLGEGNAGCGGNLEDSGVGPCG